jgi:glycosyltransferase involved in cell wall biosynthesis
MRILIPTDAFPPICGGSGWSTYELARGLRARGHEILVIRPRPGTPAGVREVEYDGFEVREFGAPAPNVPYVRNYYKSERLTRTLSRYLGDVLRETPFDIVHAQHVMTGPPAIQAARAVRVPVVCTVRDYWPVCYWSDLIHTRQGLALCPECSVGNMTRCVRPRAGAAWPLALPLIPYMRANLRRKQETLAGADAIVAVSRRIADDLRLRSPHLAGARIEIIPNAVDVQGLRARASTVAPLASPYALYLGKLAPNKGTEFLLDVLTKSRLDWPFVIAGDGPDRAALEREAAASGHDVRFTGWIDQAAAAAWLGHAAMLIFPSRGPESLSRVLIEASILGVPIAAMDTGGTRDIVEPGVTGLLSTSPEELAGDVVQLRRDAVLRSRLGDAARRRAEQRFESSAVAARVEALYRDLIAARGGAARRSPDAVRSRG